MPPKFSPEAQAAYLDSLRSGNLKYESARIIKVPYTRIEAYRKTDPEFAEAERHALAEAREGVEKVLYDSAMAGDIRAIQTWLKAHDAETYGDKKTLEIDATANALEMSRAQAITAVADLKKELLARRAELEEGVIDLPSEEVEP